MPFPSGIGLADAVSFGWNRGSDAERVLSYRKPRAGFHFSTESCIRSLDRND
jgi:hypothetical protein